MATRGIASEKQIHVKRRRMLICGLLMM